MPVQTDGATAEMSVVAVAFPIAVPGIYDYRVPERLLGRVLPGTPVLVNLRHRETWGVAVMLKTVSPFPDLKEVLDIRSDRWTDSGRSLLNLYKWVAGYYQCDLGRVFRPLMRKGLMTRRAKTVQVYSPDPDADPGSLNRKYAELWPRLCSLGTFSVREALEKCGVTRSSVNYLHRAGFLARSTRTVLREAFELRHECTAQKVLLTEEQRNAVGRVLSHEHRPEKPFLLFGITGSGKTHVYIELVSRMLEKGKCAIILVPEIALTPQTIQRFKAALGDVITVIHSNMSDGERRDSLQELVTGSKRVVIGVRSAVMAPVDGLGCIIVDEEHDGSYKQSDIEPRYNARDVAVMRGHFQNALVVLGSATPSFESYHNALSGKYHLIRLIRRFGTAALPKVTLVDMRNERKNNNWQPLSFLLQKALLRTVERERQVILLLNRRGFSTVLLCRECGYTAHCPHCSVTLRYHRAETSLKCHVCGYLQKAPDRCPGCGGGKIKYKGTGIQKVEEYLHTMCPGIRVLRMDHDSTRRKGAHARILGQFAAGEADVLLGTQMVAKGLNFPGVSLVGVIAADIGLHIPDFRAAERTFQLLTQVAGRAGRADSSGEVIIQTFSPDEVALRFAATHDFESFFRDECAGRQALGYPPWGRLARIVAVGSDRRNVQRLIHNVSNQIRSLAGNSLELLGPSPAVLERIANESRYTILLKSRNSRQLGSILSEIRQTYIRSSSRHKLIIDVDPVNML